MLRAANGGYEFAEGTFAGTHGNEQDAPEGIIRAVGSFKR
jgi:hypothetical protein